MLSEVEEEASQKHPSAPRDTCLIQPHRQQPGFLEEPPGQQLSKIRSGLAGACNRRRASQEASKYRRESS